MKNKIRVCAQARLIAVLFLALSVTTAGAANCIDQLDARSKRGKVQLVWTTVPDATGYEVFRSNELTPTEFASIGTVGSSIGIYLDFPPANGVTYLYRVVAYVAADTCQSRVVSSRPPTRRTRDANYGPVIYTEAVVAGSQGRLYRYAIGATDPEDDELEFLLTTAPADMELDSHTGLVTWLPALPGIAPVELEVRDPAGNKTTQAFLVDVADGNLGGTTKTIGPDGGSVTDNSGVSVIVPPGALAEEAIIGVEGIPLVEQLPGQVPSPILDFVGGASLGPDGILFDVPVTVVVPISRQLDEGDLLPVLVWGEARNAWIESTSSAVVLTGGLSAQFETDHFSTFTIFRGDAETSSLFGKVDPFTRLDDFILQVRNRFFNLFDLGGTVVLDPGPSPLPGQQNLDFFNCYQAIGAQFVVESDQGNAAVFLGCSTADECEIYRETQAELVFAFYREYDEVFIVPGSQGAQTRFIGDVGVEIYYDSVPPTLELEPPDDLLWVDVNMPLKYRLLCGKQGFKDQLVDAFISEGLALAAINPLSGATSADGEFDTTLTANPTNGGLITVTGLHQWTSSLGDEQLDVVPLQDANIVILSLTGDWFADGSGEDYDCVDPEDDGFGSGSGIGSFVQNGFSLSGGGEGVSIGATIVPLGEDRFTLSGTWRYEDSAGSWQGNGSVGNGTISFSGSGAGGGCKTRGGGTLTLIN